MTRTKTLVAAALLGLSILLVARVVAQEGVVGRVVNTVGQPLPGVSVMMLPASGGQEVQTLTGGDGTYRFEKVPDGRYRIDFSLRGFEMLRRNYVFVRNGQTAFADATLRVRSICECVIAPDLPNVVQRAGRVFDSEGRPLPRARVEIVAALSSSAGATPWREIVFTDHEGRFSFVAPVDSSWPLTASDSGFRPVTQQVSGSVREPLVFRLTFMGGGTYAPPTVPEYDRFDHDCGCAGIFLNPRNFRIPRN